MSKFTKFIRRYWLPLWCILSAVSILGMFVSAEYELANSNSSMKRVVASTSDKGKMFSSNLLVEGTDNPSYVPKYFSANEGSTYDVDVYLWNYSLSDITQKYPDDIDYKITVNFSDSEGHDIVFTDSEDPSGLDDTIGARTVQLVKVAPNSAETVMFTLDGTSSKMTFTSSTQTLLKESEQDHYTLKFSGDWDLEKDMDICVKMVASLDNGGNSSKYKDLSDLAAVIGLKKQSDVVSSGWQAVLAEKETGGTTAESCSGYNLVLSGAGKATIRIKWDPAVFECNKYICNDGTYHLYSFGSGEVAYDSATSTITISADNTKFRDRYDIQFYRKDGNSLTDWSFYSDTGAAIGSGIALSVSIEDVE